MAAMQVLVREDPAVLVDQVEAQVDLEDPDLVQKAQVLHHLPLLETLRLTATLKNLNPM